MPDGNHKQITIPVLVDVDEGIAELVLYLNTIPGVRTHASCKGTIGEGGPQSAVEINEARIQMHGSGYALEQSEIALMDALAALLGPSHPDHC